MNAKKYEEIRQEEPELKLPPWEVLYPVDRARAKRLNKEQLIAGRVRSLIAYPGLVEGYRERVVALDGWLLITNQKQKTGIESYERKRKRTMDQRELSWRRQGMPRKAPNATGDKGGQE